MGHANFLHSAFFKCTVKTISSSGEGRGKGARPFVLVIAA